MFLGDGDGFVRCACGHRHWGLHGAAGLLLRDPDRGVLLQHRAWWTHHGRTWALPGGAVRSTETPRQAAAREAQEEAAVPAEQVRAIAATTEEHGTWRYTTVLATLRHPVEARAVSSESAELRWVPPDEVQRLPLHRDFAATWPALRAQLGRAVVLVIDAASVLRVRVDGGWQDRASAAGRLRDELGALARDGMPMVGEAAPGWTWWPRILLVVEGSAAAIGSVPGVEVAAAGPESARVSAALRADRPGDEVFVVTDEPGLRARAAAVGARCLGVRYLLDLLNGPDGLELAP